MDNNEGTFSYIEVLVSQAVLDKYLEIDASWRIFINREVEGVGKIYSFIRTRPNGAMVVKELFPKIMGSHADKSVEIYGTDEPFYYMCLADEDVNELSSRCNDADVFFTAPEPDMAKRGVLFVGVSGAISELEELHKKYDGIARQQRVDMADKIELGGRCLEYEDKIKELEAQLLEKDSKMVELVSLLERAEDDRDSAQAAFEEADAENVKLSAEIDALKEQINKLEEDKFDIGTSLEIEKGTVDQLQDYIDELEKKLNPPKPKPGEARYITVKGVKYRV